MSDNPDLGPEGYPKICGCCQKPTMLTPPITVLVLFAPALQKPYPLIPEHAYRVCNRAGCDSIWNFVTRAAAAHEKTRGAGTWTRAIIVFQDGNGADIKNEVEGLREEPLFGGKKTTAKA